MKPRFKQTVRDYMATGFSPRESVRLARENEAPYRGEFWESPRVPHEFPLARHFVPIEHIWRGGNRCEH